MRPERKLRLQTGLDMRVLLSANGLSMLALGIPDLVSHCPRPSNHHARSMAERLAVAVLVIVAALAANLPHAAEPFRGASGAACYM